MGKLSLCMIVRDEEKNLDKCLSIARPHVDEIVIVDTGSIDGTVKIAKKYADIFEEIEWPESFAIARNYSMDLATGSHILILDGDEYIEDPNHAENDTREVYLDRAEIEALTSACYDFEPQTAAYPYIAELPLLVKLALLTSADRGVLLRLQIKDIELAQDLNSGLYRGTIRLRDKKTATRPRTIMISDSICEELKAFIDSRGSAQKVFTITAGQLRYWYEKAREAAGLENVRFKDLRSQFAIYGDKAGLAFSVIKDSMGHATESMTGRYASYQASMSLQDAEALAKEMGLERPQHSLKRVNTMES